MRLGKFGILLAVSSVLTACGGGGGGGDTAASTQPLFNQTAAGIWQTSSVVTSGPNLGATIKGGVIISPTGTYYNFSRNTTNGCASVGYGQISITGSNLSGNFQSAVVKLTTIPGVNVNCSLSDGSLTASGALSGTVTTGQSLAVTAAGQTALGTPLPSETLTFTYSPLNSTPPSLATIAGNYKASSGVAVAINSSGAVSSTVNPTTGCSISGSVSIPSATNNVYSFAYTYANCVGPYTAYNGVTVSGLASYDSAVTPNLLILGFNGTVNGKSVIGIETLSR